MPSWLSWSLVSAKAIEDAGSEAIGQLALHDFIARGELDRHVRRMRLHYQHRRDVLLDALAKWLPELKPGNGAAGLFELVALPDGVDEAALISTAAARGIGLQGLSLHRFAAGGPPGLVLGFGNLSEPAIERGVQAISAALEESRLRRRQGG
jgi:GntR family transcriptional regulator/MocR family aminotransferase